MLHQKLDLIAEEAEEESIFDALEKIALHDIRKKLPKEYFLKYYHLSLDDRTSTDNDLYVHLVAYRCQEHIPHQPIPHNGSHEYHKTGNKHKTHTPTGVPITAEETHQLDKEFAATFQQLEQQHKYHFSFVHYSTSPQP